MPLDSAHSVIRPHGTAIITDVDGRTIQRDTLRCVHCSRVWMVQPGSGRRRGFCQKCAGPVCGDEACMRRCLPWERQLEILEAGKLILP